MNNRWAAKNSRMHGSMVTKREFQDFRLHLEFKTPFEPAASIEDGAFVPALQPRDSEYQRESPRLRAVRLRSEAESP